MPESIIVQKFEANQLRKLTIPLITIYKNPRDFPNKYVARLFDKHFSTKYAIVKDSLEEIRTALPPTFTNKLERSENDDPVIVETWI